MASVVAVGEDLVSQGHFGAERIQNRLDETLGMWKHLEELVAYRRKRLEEAVDFHQVNIFIVCYYSCYHLYNSQCLIFIEVDYLIKNVT